MSQQVFLNNLFWTGKSADDTALSDPLGLDALREEISDELAPCLTSRTRHAEEAFWCLTLLRWSKSSRPAQIERSFLEWERNLKLVWAKYPCDPRTKAMRSFPGSERAHEQASSPDAPLTAFRPLLANQRSQGMLGQYRTMLQFLNLVEGLELKDAGESWSRGADDPPELEDGSWRLWRERFANAAKAYPDFRGRLRESLGATMPELRAGLKRARWGQEANWLAAAPAMGRLEGTARFAYRFCNWADSLRRAFDMLSRDGHGHKVRWPAPLSVPSRYGTSDRNRARWARVRQYNSGTTTGRLGFVATWHREEFAGRGYGNADLWLAWNADRKKIHSRPYNLPTTDRNEGSDCRWANAVNLMRP